jgi:GAF domain-containing protein
VSREETLIRSLVEMADSLVDDYDVIDQLTLLADRCVKIVGASAAGVMLVSSSGKLQLVASSSEAMRVLEVFELQANEGPCLDAFRLGEYIEQKNLEPGIGPWPHFTPLALDAGYRSVSAVPLRLRTTVIGALNLFHHGSTALDPADIQVVRAFADLATISVLHHQTVTQAQRLNEQLTYALNSRVVVEQAKGVLAERAGIDLAEAFERLRRYARSNNLLLTDVARSAVDGTLDPSAWDRPQERPQSPGATR